MAFNKAFCAPVRRSIEHTRDYVSRHKINYFMVRYEDLVSQTERTMKEVLQFIGIGTSRDAEAQQSYRTYGYCQGGEFCRW